MASSHVLAQICLSPRSTSLLQCPSTPRAPLSLREVLPSLSHLWAPASCRLRRATSLRLPWPSSSSPNHHYCSPAGASHWPSPWGSSLSTGIVLAMPCVLPVGLCFRELYPRACAGSSAKKGTVAPTLATVPGCLGMALDSVMKSTDYAPELQADLAESFPVPLLSCSTVSLSLAGVAATAGQMPCLLEHRREGAWPLPDLQHDPFHLLLHAPRMVTS